MHLELAVDIFDVPARRPLAPAPDRERDREGEDSESYRDRVPQKRTPAGGVRYVVKYGALEGRCARYCVLMRLDHSRR